MNDCDPAVPSLGVCPRVTGINMHRKTRLQKLGAQDETVLHNRPWTAAPGKISVLKCKVLADAGHYLQTTDGRLLEPSLSKSPVLAQHSACEHSACERSACERSPSSGPVSPRCESLRRSASRGGDVRRRAVHSDMKPGNGTTSTRPSWGKPSVCAARAQGPADRAAWPLWGRGAGPGTPGAPRPYE